MHIKRSHETQLTYLSLFASLPSFILLLAMMIYADISIYLILLTTLIGSVVIAYCHTRIHQRSAYQFRSLSNLLDAMIQGDYSLRARSSEGDVALNELIQSINALAQRLNKQRLQSIESQLLLETVINHIDVAIIALDNDNTISLTNPAAKHLLQISGESSPSNQQAPLTQLQQFVNHQLISGQLTVGHSKVMILNLGKQQGKFTVHVEEFREAGKPHKLIFITDVRNMLRSEEQHAWQSLVRVISHEINNSLAPISSISQTLTRQLSHQKENEHDDLIEGLGIIAQRAKNLTNFVNSYRQISHLPEPKKQASSISTLINKVTPLYQSQRITVESHDDITLNIDPVQIEQVLINLIKNAIESMQQIQHTGEITIQWQAQNERLTLTICDEGSGLSNIDNLFVPFYSTKKQGSGIGLVFCRQIIEAHQGQLQLQNREDKKGCVAIIELPLQ